MLHIQAKIMLAMVTLTLLSTHAAEISFRSLEESDLPLLYTWMQEPHLLAWWGSKPETYEQFVQEFQQEIGIGTFKTPLLVYCNTEPIGYIQYYCADQPCRDCWATENKPVTGTICLELIIGNRAYLGKGYCSHIATEFARKIFTQTDTKKIVVDPCPTNNTAIRCYERSGFTKAKSNSVLPYIETPPERMILMELKRDS